MIARRFAFAVLFPLVLAASFIPLAIAGPLPADVHPARDPQMLRGGNPSQTKTARDTLLLMGPTGSGASYTGDFESPVKALDPSDPRTNGWTSIDLTQPTETHWHISDYFAVNGDYSAYCGDETYPSCDGIIDPDGGYGNNWHDVLEYRGTVTDNSVVTIVTITGSANIFSEPGYDGTSLRAEKAASYVELAYWDGVSPGLAINETVTYLPGEYLGTGADEVVLVWRFTSDSMWSDEDCLYPTSGGIQLDDVSITSDNGIGTGGVVDFEDQTLGPFTTPLPQGVGDFAKIWSHLEDEDRCATNYSKQVAFIDDGIVVPGTGGAPCQDWCYGPFGFIVTTTGGLAGPEGHIHNAIESPYMAWGDATHRGGLLSFDVYRHEDLSADSPGMFYTWGVRSVATGDPADLEAAAWRNRNFVYYGGPDYLRFLQEVADLLVVSPTHVQIQLAVYELGWIFGWSGNDGTPAPYFDNVRFETYPLVGPSMSTREIDLAQDAFPASGTIDMADPGALSVRFDMAQDISPASHAYPSFGDSFVFDCAVTAPDAVLEGLPQLVYKVKTNPVFDPYRTSGLPATGQVDCEVVTGPGGVVVLDRYFGDLDDEGFLFPGDVVHYFVQATQRDLVSQELETSLLPADTTGFSDFTDFMNYNVSFTMRCLPSIDHVSGAQPGILFWNDFGNRGGRDEWYTAFRGLGLHPGHVVDVYYTNGPSSGVGNGLGAAATPLQLANYDIILYDCGDLSMNTIANGDLDRDSSPDLQTLTAWLDTGDKHAFLMGDDLASDLVNAGPPGSYFVSNMMNVVVNDRNIRDLIGGQVMPRVLPYYDQTLFYTVNSWIAYGGCPGINTFDAVTATGTAERSAVWTDPSGFDIGYPYSACTLATGVGSAGSSMVVSLPYGFDSIYTDLDEHPEPSLYWLAARTRILHDVLSRFGLSIYVPGPWPGTLPDADRFAASHHPNPFNPLVNLSFTIARPGRLTVKVYDVRGRLVRSLFDEQVTDATDLVWNGKDDRGAGTASGVYFYEARMHGEVQIGKVTLVR